MSGCENWGHTEMSTALQQRLHTLISECSAEVGLAIRGVNLPLEIDIHAEEVFRSASIIKVPLLAALFWLAERGELDWQHTFCLQEAQRTPGSGVLRLLQEGVTLTLRDLAVLMIVLSDNTATNILIDYVGVSVVQDFLQRAGFRRTTLQRKMYDFTAAQQGYENLCCASEIADLLRWIAQGNICSTQGEVLVSSAGCQQMIDILREQFYRDLIPASLPDVAKVANKTGEIQSHFHDCAIIESPAGTYTLAILTRGFLHRREAAAFIASLSRLVYDEIRHL